MLIFPVEQKPDWRRPPLVTLFLILANCLIFLFYQLPDNGRIDNALKAYSESGLYAQEQDLFLRHVRFEPWLRADLMASRDAGDDETVMVSLLHDLSFDQALRDREGFSGSEWETKRLAVEEVRNKISYIGYGYKPSAPSIVDALVSTFLHADFGHLFGNMLFLFIFGFGLEAALGRKAYLGIYLATGFGAVGFYQIVEWNSFAYGVGASGAISGLMGAYLAVYGLRRIRFFMTLGFYFNTFTAPAIVVFPFWIGKELLYGLFSGDSVNQWAHAGGLASGFGLILLMKVRGFTIADTALTDGAPEKQETPYQKDRRLLESTLSDLQLFKAMELCPRLLKKYPGDNYLLQAAWNLYEGLPDHALYQTVVDDILQLPAGEGDNAVVGRVYLSYRKATGNIPKSEQVCLSLAERFLGTKWQKQCVELVDHLTTTRCQDARLAPVIKNLGHQIRNTDIAKSKFFKAYSQMYFKDTTQVETV